MILFEHKSPSETESLGSLDYNDYIKKYNFKTIDWKCENLPDKNVIVYHLKIKHSLRDN